MPGPLPKRGPGRGGRHSAWVSLPADGPGRPVPALASASSYTQDTRDWWETVWSSPMACEWIPADIPALTRLARMRDLVERGDTKSALFEAIRQLEDRFGLTPPSRMRMRGEVGPTIAARVVPLGRPRPGADPRQPG